MMLYVEMIWPFQKFMLKSIEFLSNSGSNDQMLSKISLKSGTRFLNIEIKIKFYIYNK